jgi:hypothetical protein
MDHRRSMSVKDGIGDAAAKEMHIAASSRMVAVNCIFVDSE